MRIARTIAEFRTARAQASGPIGLIPTMGYLHEGHLSLVRRARAENEVCAAWIFVNPAQFGPGEDFERYPRDEERDIHLLEDEGVDLLFIPPVEEIYPAGFSSYVEVHGVTERLEGAARPGHFRGVTTVVAKFFNIMHPDRAYFGQKDAQQVVVIKKLVRDLNFPIEIVACPTVREPDGLAMSSRNAYLGPEERRAATVLYRALCQARRLWSAGTREPETLRHAINEVLAAEPLALPDYVSVADPETLEELEAPAGNALASMAVRIGRTRLIDNMVLKP
jgi:pantoate--beta-alanine ligase